MNAKFIQLSNSIEPYYSDIRWKDIDANGHINNTTIMSYFDDARRQAMMSSGYDLKSLLEKMNIRPIVTSLELNFKQEIKYPEQIKILSELMILGSVKAMYNQYAFRMSDQVLVAECYANWFFLNLETKKPEPFSSIQK